MSLRGYLEKSRGYNSISSELTNTENLSKSLDFLFGLKDTKTVGRNSCQIISTDI